MTAHHKRWAVINFERKRGLRFHVFVGLQDDSLG